MHTAPCRAPCATLCHTQQCTLHPVPHAAVHPAPCATRSSAPCTLCHTQQCTLRPVPHAAVCSEQAHLLRQRRVCCQRRNRGQCVLRQRRRVNSHKVPGLVQLLHKLRVEHPPLRRLCWGRRQPRKCAGLNAVCVVAGGGRAPRKEGVLPQHAQRRRAPLAGAAGLLTLKDRPAAAQVLKCEAINRRNRDDSRQVVHESLKVSA